MKIVALTILAYCLTAGIVFGDILRPAALLLLWPDRLGIPFWPLLALGSTLLSACIFLVPQRRSFALLYKLPIFIALTMTISTASVGVYADGIRQERTAAFKADASIEHSFFRSIREAPREFQFYLHTAALKYRVPYAWSYRTMNFYELPANVAVNVIPGAWLKRCSIHRT